MSLDPTLLDVPLAREDKARRQLVSVVILGAVLLALFLGRQQSLWGIPGPVLAAGVVAGAFLVAWRNGIVGRAHAMLRLPSIRARGLEATRLLNAGELAGARAGYEALIVEARPLGAFHAVHVLMLGVVRFFEGDTRGGLQLATHAIESGWFSVRQTRDVLSAAETWRVLMLLHAGELAQARAVVSKAPVTSLQSAELAVLAYDEKWDEAFVRATALLEDPQFPAAGRAMVALIGRFAARRAGKDTVKFEEALRASPPSPLTAKNPALARFL